jgi:hypothetical protein
MEINFEDYANDGWGISRYDFQKLYSLFKNDNRKILRVLEFGSGVSTRFFSDLSKILDKEIYITSFDDSEEFMYKGTSDPKVVVNLRLLEETSAENFEKMFIEGRYNNNYMTRKTSESLMNQFYMIRPDDLSGVYDYLLLDGPHGNGRSLAFLRANANLAGDTVVFIDDFTHYDFVNKFLGVYDAKELFRHVAGSQSKWTLGGDFIIFRINKHIMKNIEVVDFRFAEATDGFNEKYKQEGAWSRIYEYPYVTEFIKNNIHKDSNFLFSIPEIHNCAWGFEGIHVTFRDELDTLGKCVHSDIVHSDFRDSFYYDITTENKEFESKFDFVVNVSTIEHLPTAKDRITSIENLLKQVKTGGYLILTFDYPRVNLLEIETLVGTKCKVATAALNGENSAHPNKNYKDLNIVYLILKKNE